MKLLWLVQNAELSFICIQLPQSQLVVGSFMGNGNPKQCLYCSAPFQSSRTSHIFCSPYCSLAYRRTNGRSRKITYRICPSCLNQFRVHKRRRKHCSRRCAKVVYWSQQFDLTIAPYPGWYRCTCLREIASLPQARSIFRVAIVRRFPPLLIIRLIAGMRQGFDQRDRLDFMRKKYGELAVARVLAAISRLSF